MTIRFLFEASEEELKMFTAAAESATAEKTTAETEKATNAAEYEDVFSKAVKLLTTLDGETFYRLVEGSRPDNRFHVDDNSELGILSKIVNADDCYCTAIIELTRWAGENYENFMFSQIISSEADDRIHAFDAAKAVMAARK